MRIALVTESKSRKGNGLPAKEFYRGTKSHWVNNIIRYLETSNIKENNCYFLSFYQERIIPFNETMDTYPTRSKIATAAEGKLFAKKILDFLHKFKEKPFVELHVGKVISEPLSALLNEYGFSYKIYAESLPLAMKAKYYEDLIEKQQQAHKMKEIQRNALKLVGNIELKTPYEAQVLLEQYEDKASLYGVEDIFQTLKDYLKKFHQRNKDSQKALTEFEVMMNSCSDPDELYDFVQSIRTLNNLFDDIERYELLKRKYGRELAKFVRYKIKQGYALTVENDISKTMHQLSVVLLKRISRVS